MRIATKFAVALALILAAVMVTAAGLTSGSPADAHTTSLTDKRGSESVLRTAKGDRLDSRPQVRTIAGVTMVLRNFDQTIR